MLTCALARAVPAANAETGLPPCDRCNCVRPVLVREAAKVRRHDPAKMLVEDNMHCKLAAQAE